MTLSPEGEKINTESPKANDEEEGPNNIVVEDSLEVEATKKMNCGRKSKEDEESREVQPITPPAIIIQPQSPALGIIHQTPPTILFLNPLFAPLRQIPNKETSDYKGDSSIRLVEL